MQKKPIFITRTDLERLNAFFQDYRNRGLVDAGYVKSLQEELDRAQIIDAKSIAGDVITLRSRAVLKDLDTNEETTHTLVYPDESDPSHGKISILSPVGTAMLGYRAGDTFEWKVPSGLARYQVVRVEYQPEASGDFHL